MTTSEVLAILAAICFALAATLQQKGSLALDGDASIVQLVKIGWWLIGTGVLLVGYGVQAVALNDGRLSIVQPLLVMTVVFALPFGYFITAQKVGRAEVIGACVVVFGLALYAYFGDPATGNDSAPNDESVKALIVIGAVCIVLFLLSRSGTSRRKAALLGVMAGILFGTSASFVKEVTTQLDTQGISDVVTHWEFWGMAIAGIAAFVIQQMSLRQDLLATSVSTVSVANPIVSVLIGIVIFDEVLDDDPSWYRVVAWIGLGLGMLGAFIISGGSEGSGEGRIAAETGRPSAAESTA